MTRYQKDIYRYLHHIQTELFKPMDADILDLHDTVVSTQIKECNTTNFFYRGEVYKKSPLPVRKLHPNAVPTYMAYKALSEEREAQYTAFNSFIAQVVKVIRESNDLFFLTPRYLHKYYNFPQSNEVEPDYIAEVIPKNFEEIEHIITSLLMYKILK